MKKILLFVMLLLCFVAQAQRFPEFKPLRYDEDYSMLGKDSLKNNWYKTLKYLPVSKSGNTYISFGGDIRYQYFYIKNENWGDDPKDPDGYLLTRSLFHADFHAGSHFRTFVQLQSSTADGKTSSSPVDLNPLELHQAFADIKTGTTTQAVLRLGRQELSYGSQRLVAVRDGPNNRQSFDAAKLMVKSGNYSADVFYSQYVVAQKDIFDDKSSHNKTFWGSYLVINKVPVIKNIDLYYFGYKRNLAAFNDGTGKETRHSFGSRIWGKSGDWRYDCEAVYQIGKMSDKDISAYTASLNAGYKLSGIKFRPEIGLKTEVISGDSKQGDNNLQTFNPLFPRGAYFGLASVIGPSNLIDLHPSLNFELAKTVNWVIDYDMFWRYSSHDAIYAPNVTIIYPGNTTNAKKIGRQLETEIVYQPNQYLYFRTEFTWFQAGDFLKASGTGKDILFAGVTMQLKF